MTQAHPPRLTRTVLTVAQTDLRRLSHDRTALFFTVLLPLMIIYVIGLAFEGEDFQPRVGIADLDHTSVAADLVASLPDVVEVVPYDSERALREAVRGTEVIAGLVVPVGLGAAVGGEGAVTVELVTDPTRTGSAGVATVLRSTVDDLARRAAVVVVVAEVADAERSDVAARLATDAVRAGASVTTTTVGAAEGDGGTGLQTNHIAAGNLVLFVFITSLVASGGIIRARRLGIARRALAAPVRPSHVLLGFAAGRFAIAVFQAVVIVVAGGLVFGVRWGDPVAAFVLVLALTLAGTGVGLVAATILRTEDQASAVGPPIGIALGMLGGCMWPLEIVPAPMRTVGHLTPHAWAMDAFADLFERGAGLAGILPEIGVLFGVAAVLVAIGMARIGPHLTRAA
ncbi:MAG: ABC transporter permease [Actinobacteria bacterium]|nr:ABC transporter permease [Actinomycetota bacterium]